MNSNIKTDIVEETTAIKAAAEVAQRYRILCRAVIALAFGFFVMVGCCIWAVVNAQTIANNAMLDALIAVSEMEVVSETTTTTTTEVTQDTGEGSGNNVYLDGDQTTYNEGGAD